MRIKVAGILACVGLFMVGCGNTSSTTPESSEAEAAVADNASVADEPTGIVDEIQLINGTVADQSMYPASVLVTSGGGSCTGTIVGKNVMLIAAHCVDHGATANFSVGGKRYSSVCSQASLYRRGTDLSLIHI